MAVEPIAISLAKLNSSWKVLVNSFPHDSPINEHYHLLMHNNHNTISIMNILAC